MRTISIILLCWLCQACSQEPNRHSVHSPNNQIHITVQLNDKGQLTYQVDKNDTQLLMPSKLGFTLQKQPTLETFEIISSQIKSFKKDWQAVWGERKNITNEYNELFIALKDKQSERKINMRFRAYDDGIAFRYEFPQQTALSNVVIMDEKTQFNLAQDYQSWWIEADYDSYEKLYKQSPVSQVEHVQTPFTMRSKNGVHLSIHEAALTDYASMTLKHEHNSQLSAELVPWQDGTKVKTKVPFRTPWRTLQIADSAAQLASSDLILNLNEANKISETAWIKPMKYIGIWWGIHLGVHTWQEGERHAATTERAMQYIDFAKQHNIQGVLFEGWNKGWEQWGTREAYLVATDDFDLEKVADYAKLQGVAIVGHNETGGNIAAYESHVNEIFSTYNKLGINTVKTGYVAEKGFSNGEHHQGQFGVNHYRKIVKLAAKYHIMLNAHEPIKDTGIRRTWPNMMTREGARGGEYNAWSDGNSADYTMILPFTRLLSGPMDYTPGIFDIDYSRFQGQRFDWQGNPQKSHYRVHTTLARQLANMLVLYSPLQMAADMIENYQDHPAFEFIKALNVDYDDSKVLSAEIGEYISVARRAKQQWFIASATNSEARKLSLKLDFLPANRQYFATIYHDAANTDWQNNPEAYEIKEQVVDASTVLNLQLAAAGGAAISLIPLDGHLGNINKQ
ncbi:glycoside hydrolase family 97 protein [Pseudoalteromonas prydzensis]|uniref:glycoside hydrolase family 97 protein n=1 Tax=Pseudoalteromonas prydzensis TaxID=182141 RepID=UPI003703F9F7